MTEVEISDKLSYYIYKIGSYYIYTESDGFVEFNLQYEDAFNPKKHITLVLIIKPVR